MKEFEEVYNEMSPYRDGEVEAAIKRILQQEEFMAVLKYAFPDKSLEESLEIMNKLKTVSDFQTHFSSPAVRTILQKTATEFTYSGLENIDRDTSYLFISNHRDIVLDSAFLQYVINKNGHRTSQITFGSNLMSSQFIVDMGKVNKMFTFYRGGSRVDIYRNALIHSSYIKKVLTEENESVWIAQRDGRTKDGDDRTQLSLLKMLTIKEKNHIAAFKKFNIIPISISFEFEPCDIYKVRENIIKSEHKYKKSEDEDFNSVLNGILSPKGKVHLAFGTPINEFIDAKSSELNNENIHQEICDEMDRQIWHNYKLTRFNYVAFDIMNMSQKYLGDKYSEDDLETVMDVIEKKVAKIDDVDSQEMKDGLIRMYAMPVFNALHKKCKN